MGQSERIANAFQETAQVDPSKVSLSAKIKGIDKVDDDRLKDFILENINWAYGEENLISKIKKAYPEYIDGSLIFLNSFTPNEKQEIVFMDLEDYEGLQPLLFTDVNDTDVKYTAKLQILVENE